MSAKIARIFFTRHAETMLSERGIEREWIERTLSEPESVEPDPLRPEIIRAFRGIKERDGRILRVVYIQTGNAARVVTAFFDRSRRP